MKKVVVFISIGVITIVLLASSRYLKKAVKNTALIQPAISATQIPSKPSPTWAEWKTYTNTAFGYAVNYPTYMGISSDTLVHHEVAHYLYITQSSLRHRGGYFFVYVNTKVRNMDLRDYVKREWKTNTPEKQPQVENQYVSDISDVSFAGEEGFEYTVAGSLNYDNGNGELIDKLRVIFIKRKGNVYQISFPPDDSEYNRMAATFRFLH
jgi:hypothetical protein